MAPCRTWISLPPISKESHKKKGGTNPNAVALRKCMPRFTSLATLSHSRCPPDDFKNKSSDFTRKRKLDFKTVFAVILASAYTGKDSSLSSDKNSFYSFCRIFGAKMDSVSPHKSSISRAKAKLPYKPFKFVLDQIVNKYQAITKSNKSLKWKLYAVDGTRLRFPAEPQIREY
jgi:hypothetical protein